METAEFWFLVVVKSSEIHRILTMIVVRLATEIVIGTEYPQSILTA